MVFPCIDPSTGGELCFISSTHGDRRIQCNCNGNLSMDKNWKGWEVWRIVRSDRNDGSFFISSWTHSQFYLSSHPKGRVTSSKNQQEWELWKVEMAGSGSETTALIRSLAHNRLLQLQDGQLHTVKPSHKSDKCLWNLETANLGNFFLRCNEKDQQIGCPHSATLSLTENRKKSEVWNLQKIGESNGFTIRSEAHGWYLRCDEKNKTVYLATEPGSETWYIANHKGLMAIVSSFGGYLACCSEGRFFIASDPGDKQPCTSWTLEPRMPHTISGKQIGGLVGAGLVTLGLGIAMPFAIVGVVNAMGFTAGGIAAGSAAAGMMSAEAISLGGAVAAGGTVATLQSIGAVGLGTVATTAAVSGGAIVGSVASAKVLGTSGIMNNGIAPSEAGVAGSDM
ncbi:MAG: hypothetical protein SGBAC_002559 [Bacillariaceae sp.]